MVIEWTNPAIQDLKEFKENSKIIDTTGYILKLVQYVKTLSEFSRLGKIYFYTKGYIIRQLVYQKHRIFYYINDNTIYILAIVHHRQDIQKKIRYIKKYF